MGKPANSPKILHFYRTLPELILNRSKTSTWRINDKKEIKTGDILSLCRDDDTEFAKAVVTSVKETTFGRLTKTDKEGHEKFSSDAEMYKTFTRYYNFSVKPETKLKIIRFELNVKRKTANIAVEKA